MAASRPAFPLLATFACASLGLCSFAADSFAQAPGQSGEPPAAPAKASTPAADPAKPAAPAADPANPEPPKRDFGPRRGNHPDGDGKGPGDGKGSDGRGHQDRPSFGPGPSRGPGGPDGGPNAAPAPSTPELDALRDGVMKELNALTVEQRNDVWRTVWTALRLPQEQRKTILGLEDDRRKQAREEVDQFLKDNDIHLANDQRRRFFHRFFPERRTIEETLKKENEARRVDFTEKLNAKLKQEFTPPPEGTPASPDSPKTDQPKRDPGSRGDFPFRPPGGDRPNGDRAGGEGKGPDGKGPDGKGPDGKGPDGKPRSDWRGPGRGGPGGPGGPGGFGPGGPGGSPFQGPPAPPTAQQLQAMRDRAMKEIEKLTPEQRTEVWRTVSAVMKLSEEKRKEIVTLQEELRKKAREDSTKEVEQTLQTIGVQLANEQRGRFYFRYFSERHAMDEKLKKEDETHRTALMKDLGAKLKVEFATPTVVAPAPDPK
jgi:hypothetical protein